jgi:hypothetical protein
MGACSSLPKEMQSSRQKRVLYVVECSVEPPTIHLKDPWRNPLIEKRRRNQYVFQAQTERSTPTIPTFKD